MKSFKFYLSAAVFMSMVSFDTMAYDIAVKNEDGVTIYYNYISNGKELEVTRDGLSYENIPEFDVSVLRIPNEVSYMNKNRKVTRIADGALRKMKADTLIIGDNVTYVGDVFDVKSGGNRVSRLKLIVIGNNVESFNLRLDWYGSRFEVDKVIIKNIEKWASSDHYGNSNSIWNNFFYHTKKLYADYDHEITEIILPNGVQRIGEYAFSCLNIERVFIPASVGEIGDYAFTNSNINTFYFEGAPDFGDGSHPFWLCKYDNVIIGDLALWCQHSCDQMDGYKLYLGNEDNQITKLTIPEGIKEINRGAFHGVSKLTEVVIPDFVTAIGYNAFRYCHDLKTLSIGNGLEAISSYCFSECPNLSVIHWGNNIKHIYRNAFWHHGISKLIIPHGIESIEDEAFESDSLKMLVIPESVKSIDESAFSSDNLSIVISLIKDPFPIPKPDDSRQYTPDNPFSRNTLFNATLYVPKGTIEKYQNTPGWKRFVWIEEFDGTPEQIEEILLAADIKKPHTRFAHKAYYNLNGVSQETLKKGINIIKMSDGTTKKVLVK